MAEFNIRDVTEESVDDLCRMCIPPEKMDDPIFVKGREEKKKWAMEMLERWGSFAKIAYQGSAPVGLLQYEPVPAERIASIHCVFVPEKGHWQKGIATRLLSSLIEDMKRPKGWFANKPALTLVTRTFPGELPGQYPARLFFTRKGFKSVGEDPDFLYYPIEQGYGYQPIEEERKEYLPQKEDRGKALIIYGPSFCPFSYFFLKKAEEAIMGIAPELPIRWISKSEDPDAVKKRGNVEGCIVNAKPIRSFVLDKEDFQKEVKEALMGT
jgi:GNAT superfamily N-acetyltransferase